jgi:membrane-associated protease RseP (regulator of RpoE activity)
MGIIISLLIFSLVVFVHEMGHLLVGLKMGAAPKTFSIGFGQTVFSKVIKGINFKIGMIPFGGYVELGKDSNHPDPEKRISHLKGILVYLAGPFFNIVLSWTMLFLLVLKVGLNTPKTQYEFVFYNIVESHYPEGGHRILNSIEVTNQLTAEGLKYFVTSFKPSQLLSQSSGPIGITHEISDTLKSKSWIKLYFLVLMLSASLGITNLVPLGILDGGRVLNSMVKMIFADRANFVLKYYDYLSIAIVFGFFIAITVKDIIAMSK